MPTIPEQLKTVYDDMMTRAQTDENFSPIFRENRRQLEKSFSAIIKATEEPSLDADTDAMSKEDRYKLRIRQELQKANLTLTGKFEFGDIMYLKEYPHFQFIFKLDPHDNTISITCKFSKLDICKNYNKHLNNDVFLSLEHNTDYSSFNVRLKNEIITSLDNLTTDLQTLINNIRPLADCFDADNN